ncbi:MAG: MarR family transcriptional regulator [Patescibacteria group bacterium]|nr:MarR family transcriptional regulator [Patescibacteria group bacterium]
MTDPSVSPAGMRLVKLLVGKPPMTIAQLIDATGVTRTAVTEQLGELVAAGFVERNLERLPGRGRPHHLYVATDAALLLLFADVQRLVVPAIWKALGDAGGDVLTQQVIMSVAARLAEHYCKALHSDCPKGRMKEMGEILRQEGALVEVCEEDGGLMLRKRSCPFISMLDENRSVCCIDEQMLSIAVGHPVRRVDYRQEGDPCCTFQLANGQQ